MTKLEQFKAAFMVRLRWIGWILTLTVATLFIFFNLTTVKFDWVLGTIDAQRWLIYAILFLLGWYSGNILQFTVQKVRTIEEKYREKMTLRPGAGIPLDGTAPAPAAPAPAAPPAPTAASPAPEAPPSPSPTTV